MTVNELIKILRKLKRKNVAVGDWEIAIRNADYIEPLEIRGIEISDYDDCIEITGEY